jgi:hypothetical protein
MLTLKQAQARLNNFHMTIRRVASDNGNQWGVKCREDKHDRSMFIHTDLTTVVNMGERMRLSRNAAI